MENSAVYSRIDDLMAKADEIKLAVDEFGEMLEDIQTFTNETNVVVKDILNGRQLSEWIADLAASGKSSATYADASRMQALAEDTDACKNVQVSQHIFDWCVTNNKVGTYYNSIFGTVSGVTWSSLTTPALAYANASAFAKVANDSTAFTTAMDNVTAKRAIYNAYATTEAIIKSSSIALSILTARRQGEETLQGMNNNEFEGKIFVLTYKAETKTSCYPTVYYPDGSYREFEEDSSGSLNKFVTRIYAEGHYNLGRWSRFAFYYVDFS